MPEDLALQLSEATKVSARSERAVVRIDSTSGLLLWNALSALAARCCAGPKSGFPAISRIALSISSGPYSIQSPVVATLGHESCMPHAGLKCAPGGGDCRPW